MHGFTGAVDAALGPGQDVDGARRIAAGDAAVREIEAAARHVDKDEIAALSLGDQRGRREAASAADETGGEDRAAIGVSGRLAENLVVRGEQRQCDT